MGECVGEGFGRFRVITEIGCLDNSRDGSEKRKRKGEAGVALVDETGKANERLAGC